jgi:protein-L-isoaspartate(D-aspartate) O-methyltransferase
MTPRRGSGRLRPGTVAAAVLGAVLAVLLGAVLAAAAPPEGASGERADERRRMVDQLAHRGIDDPRLLAALAEVPRHRFVPFTRRARAYYDEPLPIGYGQTISQPSVVAMMCDLLELEPGDRVLEIGTGSGYHAAVLSQLAGEVYSIEIVEPLGRRAGETLVALGYGNVHVRVGDGYEGWPEKAPFDAVVLTAAPPEVPRPLLEQLAVGGRLVVPVGGAWEQELQVITRTADDYRTEHVAPVRFVPMTGKAGG